MLENHLKESIDLIAGLPGLGKRSAKRIILKMLKNRENLMIPLADSLKNLAGEIKNCANCGNLDISDPCYICNNQSRDHGTLCIVEDVADLWAMEQHQVFSGIYHVLGGTLNALEGRGPADIKINEIKNRVIENNISEVIIATNATADGQTTAFYIADLLADSGCKISRLAQGIPMGGELDYLDEGTLSAALTSRKDFSI